MRYANTTSDRTKFYSLVYGKGSRVKYFSRRKLYYSQSLDEKCSGKRSNVIFSESQRSKAIFQLDRV